MVANPSSHSHIALLVFTDSASDITETKATLKGHIVGIGKEDDCSCGFYYGTDESLKAQNSEFISAYIQENGSFVANLDKLNPETKYYFRAVSTFNGETVIADEIRSFKTKEKKKVAFKLVQTDSSSTNENLSGTFKCILQEGDSTKCYVMCLEETNGCIFYNDVWFCSKESEPLYFYFKEYNLDYQNWKATSEGTIKVKYAIYDGKELSEIDDWAEIEAWLSEKDDWEHTELPVNITYNKPPYYEMYISGYYTVDGQKIIKCPACRIEGAIWFSSITASYGLYSKVNTYDDDRKPITISTLLDQKTFTWDEYLSDSDDRDGNYGAGWNLMDFPDWSEEYQSGIGYDIQIFDTSATLKNGENL